MDDMLAQDARQEARTSQTEEECWLNTKPCPRCGSPIMTNHDSVGNDEGEEYLPGEVWICPGSCGHYEEVQACPKNAT
jgi:hypothetical protein